jgi:hypothetical protein
MGVCALTVVGLRIQAEEGTNMARARGSADLPSPRPKP